MKLKIAKNILTALLLASIWQPVWAAEPDLTQSRSGDVYNLDAGLRQNVKSQPAELPVEKNADLQQRKPLPEHKAGAKIFLTSLQVDRSSILTATEIAAITSKYEGREVSLQDIHAAVEEINLLYAQKKNFIARAVLLPQKVEKGNVKITLAESRIGKYRVEGALYTRDQYFTERMALQTGDLLRLDRLEQDVIRFNKTNTTRLKVVLVKGEGFGTTDVVLKAVEPPQQQTLLFGDNAGSESTGLYRTGLVWSTSSLKGGGDSFSINMTHAKGNTGGGVSYQTPVNHFGTQLGFSYNKNQSDVIAGVFQSLQIEGDSSDTSVSLNHPFRTTLTGKLNGFIELHKKTAVTYFSGANLTDITVNSGVIGLAEQTSFDQGMRYARFDMTTGNVDKKGQGFPVSSENFTKFNLSYVVRQHMPDNHALLLRLSGQFNLNHERELPSTERFTLGGFSTVRGYKEGDLTGDRGYFISGEYHFPVGKTEGVVFIDHGGAFVHGLSADRDRYMTSTGVGIIAALAQNTSLQLFVGAPIVNNKYDDGLRVHFFLQHVL